MKDSAGVGTPLDIDNIACGKGFEMHCTSPTTPERYKLLVTATTRISEPSACSKEAHAVFWGEAKLSSTLQVCQCQMTSAGVQQGTINKAAHRQADHCRGTQGPMRDWLRGFVGRVWRPHQSEVSVCHIPCIIINVLTTVPTGRGVSNTV